GGVEVQVRIVGFAGAAGRGSLLAPGRHPGGFRTKAHSASRRLAANAIAHRDRPPQPRPAADARGTARRYRLPFLPPSPPRRARTHHAVFDTVTIYRHASPGVPTVVMAQTSPLPAHAVLAQFSMAP